MKLELITAEGPATLWMRKGRLIRFPQLTMPLLAALTPEHVEIHHTDEIVSPVNFSRAADLVGITTTTCSAPHAYEVADEFRRRGVAVVLGGPHPTLLPHEAARHADSVLIGEAEGVWPARHKRFPRGPARTFLPGIKPPGVGRVAVGAPGTHRAQGLRTRSSHRHTELSQRLWLLHAAALLSSSLSLPPERGGDC